MTLAGGVNTPPTFPKLSAAFDFVYYCVCWDEGAMSKKVKQLKKYYKPDSSDDAKGEDESYESASESDCSDAATEDSP